MFHRSGARGSGPLKKFCWPVMYLPPLFRASMVVSLKILFDNLERNLSREQHDFCVHYVILTDLQGRQTWALGKYSFLKYYLRKIRKVLYTCTKQQDSPRVTGVWRLCEPKLGIYFCPLYSPPSTPSVLKFWAQSYCLNSLFEHIGGSHASGHFVTLWHPRHTCDPPPAPYSSECWNLRLDSLDVELNVLSKAPLRFFIWTRQSAQIEDWKNNRNSSHTADFSLWPPLLTIEI